MRRVQQLAAENRELQTRLADPGPADGAARAPLGPEECARRILLERATAGR
jgi:hypothetical protein